MVRQPVCRMSAALTSINAGRHATGIVILPLRYPYLFSMTHWHYVLIAYGLSALALVLELVLLVGRRRHARHCMEDANS